MLYSNHGERNKSTEKKEEEIMFMEEKNETIKTDLTPVMLNTPASTSHYSWWYGYHAMEMYLQRMGNRETFALYV